MSCYFCWVWSPFSPEFMQLKHKNQIQWLCLQVSHEGTELQESSREVCRLFFSPPGVSQEHLEDPSSKAAAPWAQVVYTELQTTEKAPWKYTNLLVSMVIAAHRGVKSSVEGTGGPGHSHCARAKPPGEHSPACSTAAAEEEALFIS